MKNKLGKFLLAFTFGLSMAAVTNVAEAYWRHGYWYSGPNYYYYNQPYYKYKGPYYKYKYKPQYRCRWVPAHWAYGYWYPAQKVCW